MNRAILVATTIIGWIAIPPTLSDVEFLATEVTDSGSYFVYRYLLVNPATSASALVAFEMENSASSGTPAFLASSGDFRDRTALGTPEPWAEVGLIVPAGWRGNAWSEGKLTWTLPYSAWESEDSVAPGDSVAGFGIRSSYLPGLRAMTYRQTPESCCTEELEDSTVTAVLATPFDFEVTGWSIGPRYKPDEVTLDILESQLDTVCDDPLWIEDEDLCEELSDSLDIAQARHAINNHYGVEPVLDSVRSILTANQSSIHSNAWFMLYRNASQIIYDFFDSPPEWAVMNICAAGPAAGTAYYTVSATADTVWVASPFALDIEVDGVDPPGSSCTTAWKMAPEVTSLTDVTVVLDSVSNGLEVTFLGTSGGLEGHTVVSGDTVTMRHDGITPGLTHWLFDPPM